MVRLPAICTGRTLLSRSIIFLFLVLISVRDRVIFDWNNAAASSTMIPILLCFSQSFQTGTETVYWTIKLLSAIFRWKLTELLEQKSPYCETDNRIGTLSNRSFITVLKKAYYYTVSWITWLQYTPVTVHIPASVVCDATSALETVW
jgi:hypothetical protein